VDQEWDGGRPCDQVKAYDAANVWQGWISSAASACAPCRGADWLSLLIFSDASLTGVPTVPFLSRSHSAALQTITVVRAMWAWLRLPKAPVPPPSMICLLSPSLERAWLQPPLSREYQGQDVFKPATCMHQIGYWWRS